MTSKLYFCTRMNMMIPITGVEVAGGVLPDEPLVLVDACCCRVQIGVC